MYPSDICDETEWFLTPADADMLTASGIDPDADYRPADTRDVVQELWHSMQIGRVNLLDAVIDWDRADAHLLDGARTPTAWLRHRLRTTHTNAVHVLTQARGLRGTPQVREALLTGSLSFDQADQLLHVFTAARANYVARDVDMLLDHISAMPVAQCRIVAGHWAARVDVTVNLDQLTTAHLTGNAESPYSLSGLDMASVLQTCCDASVTRILTAGPSLTLDIGRETRVILPALRKAVTTRDRTCRFPGCDMPARFTDVHHIWHWTRGGPTAPTAACCADDITR